MNQRIWTIEEDNYIRENFGKTTFSAMAKHLSVSIATVENRAKALGFTIKEKTIRRWTTEEIELLKVMAPKYLNKTIAKKLNRSLNELNKKARDLGIKLIFKRPVWKKWKIKFLIENINKIPISRIQRELDVNYYQIMDKLEELNIEYHSTNWTPEEIELLTTLAPKVYITEIAKVINRTPGAIRSKAYKMDLDYITLDREYTEDEIEYIKNNWSIVPITDMARKLGVSRNMVQTQADIIGLPKLGNNPYRKWTEEEIARLKKLAKTKTIPQLAKVFKTTNDAIITIAYRQNITLIDSKVHWTDEDNKILRDLAKTLDLSELATAMNRSTSAIRLQAERLNIKIIPNKKHSQSIWTEENTKELKRLAAEGKTALEIAILMKKLDDTITKKAREFNIELKKDGPHPWTDEDIKKFTELAKTKKLIDIMIELFKPTQSIKKMAKKLGINLLTDKKTWTKEEYEQLEKLVKMGKSPKEIADELDRSEDAIVIKINRQGLKIQTNDKRFWTPEEETILSDLWGTISKEKIAKKLNRTVSSITNKANLLELGSYIENNYEGLTFKDISTLLNIGIGTISVGWVSLGLKYKIKNISASTSYRYVEIKDLYDFLEANQNIWDSRNLEKNILGIEPDWLKEKRKRDNEENPNYENLKLTKQQLILSKKFFLELQEQIIAKETHPEIEQPKTLKKVNDNKGSENDD